MGKRNEIVTAADLRVVAEKCEEAIRETAIVLDKASTMISGASEDLREVQGDLAVVARDAMTIVVRLNGAIRNALTEEKIAKLGGK